MAQADPFASIATPIAQSAPSVAAGSTGASASAQADPFASIATPIAPEKSTMSKVGDAAYDALLNPNTIKGEAEGLVQSAGETIQSLPWVGKKIISPEAMQAEREYFKPGSPAEEYGKTTGDIAEPILEFVMGDEALKDLAIADKIGIASKIAKIAQDSPYIGKLLQHGVNAAREGTVGAVEAKAKGASLPDALKTGAEIGGASLALGAGADAAKEVLPKLRINPFIKTLTDSPEARGEAVAQPIAQAGVRRVAPTVGPSLRSGIDVDTPFKDAKALYRTVDDAAKTDFKGLYDKLDAAQDDARLAAPGSPEEAKAQLNIKNTQDAIDDAKDIAAKSGVKDIDGTLRAADKKYTETQANKDFNSKFFGSQGVINGNVAHGAPETINVDAAIKVLENMDKPNRYGVSRLQQTSLGPKGVAELKQVLYDAQKAGNNAMSSRELRNTIGKFIGYAGAATEGAGLLNKIVSK